MKILISTKINIDLFCKNPTKILENSNDGAVAVLKNNAILFYTVTPEFLEKLFNIQYQSEHPKKEKITKKFSMHSKWSPDEDFIHQAALWGIFLTEKVKKSELACFISYWEAEGCFFHHVQWQQKLARSLEKSRTFTSFLKKKRDITYIPSPDQKTPDGFRGK